MNNNFRIVLANLRFLGTREESVNAGRASHRAGVQRELIAARWKSD